MFLNWNRLSAFFEYQTFSEMNEMGGTAGVWCGWSMAVIYMGGRLPQIYLNVRFFVSNTFY